MNTDITPGLLSRKHRFRVIEAFGVRNGELYGKLDSEFGPFHEELGEEVDSSIIRTFAPGLLFKDMFGKVPNSSELTRAQDSAAFLRSATVPDRVYMLMGLARVPSNGSYVSLSDLGRDVSLSPSVTDMASRLERITSNRSLYDIAKNQQGFSRFVPAHLQSVVDQVRYSRER